MQKLLEEINKKRKLSEELHRNSEEKIGTTKYIRQSDVRRIELEKKIATQEAIDLERRRHVEKTADNLNDPKFHVELNNPYEELLKLTEDEIKMRLRTLGKPITLFGEDFVERARRLHKIQNEDLQDDEYRLGAAHNNISENLSGHTALPGTLHLEKNKSNNKNDDDDDDDENENEGPDESNKKGPGTILTNFSHTPGLTPEKIVYKYFRNLNKQWEWDLSLREEAEKLCAKGKLETRTQKQCKDYIRPLFKLCKKGEVPLDILSKLVTMVQNCEEGNFREAHDVYLQAAIGNSAWPIGLTMVGIHERSGREKISTSKVAHIMNNELQRKYFTSVKRLMTYAQNKRTDVAPSMKAL